MSDEADNRHGDVWIMFVANEPNYLPEKYLSLMQQSVSYGPAGPVHLWRNFNLSAFVRDMIAEAGK